MNTYQVCFNLTGHQENRNQNHNVILQPSRMVAIQNNNKITSIGEDINKFKPSFSQKMTSYNLNFSYYRKVYI